ncbi:hypothetical protein BLNAU_12795 [Blattamonas nauphoetae]|uniref:Uncharacterized protein n=1 Tax=Blattamonas nauphoetae TaxID=2049346 RepID=A0ABQ9XIH9_9EUKA|nr:hypothetical protein BLNAU_12795 [Blattamonas nauphoetae]
MEEMQEHPLHDRHNEEEQQQKAQSTTSSDLRLTRVLSVIGSKDGRRTRNGKRDWDLPHVFAQFTTNTTDVSNRRPKPFETLMSFFEDRNRRHRRIFDYFS